MFRVQNLVSTTSSDSVIFYNCNYKDADNLSVAFSSTAEALAAQVTEENYEKGLIYPPFTSIRKISANIAAKVAAKSYELGKLSISALPLIND